MSIRAACSLPRLVEEALQSAGTCLGFANTVNRAPTSSTQVMHLE